MTISELKELPPEIRAVYEAQPTGKKLLSKLDHAQERFELTIKTNELREEILATSKLTAIFGEDMLGFVRADKTLDINASVTTISDLHLSLIRGSKRTLRAIRKALAAYLVQYKDNEKFVKWARGVIETCEDDEKAITEAYVELTDMAREIITDCYGDMHTVMDETYFHRTLHFDRLAKAAGKMKMAIDQYRDPEVIKDIVMNGLIVSTELSSSIRSINWRYEIRISK